MGDDITKAHFSKAAKDFDLACYMSTSVQDTHRPSALCYEISAQRKSKFGLTVKKSQGHSKLNFTSSRHTCGPRDLLQHVYSCRSVSQGKTRRKEIWRFLVMQEQFNPLNPELNPICYLLALLGAQHFLHVSRIRVKSLTLRLLMSYIYGAPILDVSRSHATTQHSR